ncbi:MarR family winged helix-turn-helix transcriptional regulator [Flagellimonas allohymeniacidonis]|nr:MarR family transcriptional regulator [Allomuricauda hymeniacidonis]
MPLGFSISEAHLMGYLINNAPSPINRLIKVFGLKNSTLTSILNRLEKKALLERKISPRDRRSFEIQLTKRGENTAYELYHITRKLEDDILKTVSTGEINSLRSLAKKIEKIV